MVELVVNSAIVEATGMFSACFMFDQHLQMLVAVLATGFLDLNPAHAVPIPRERAGFTKSYNPTGFLRNSRDTELRAELRCTQIGD